MSVAAETAPKGRVPRHVWVLLLVAVLVLGFALGGAVRTAVTSRPGRAPAAPAGVDLLGSSAGVHALALGADLVTAPTASGGRQVPVVAPSAVRRGVPLPAGSGTGRRIVYQESTMHLWVVEADGVVTRDYPVTGRPGWPTPGTYHVFTKSVAALSPAYHVSFDWMVAFAHGHRLPIGFHSIPRWMGSGLPIQPQSTLGAPIGEGGCVRQRPVDAKWLFTWAALGTTVVVLH